MLIQTAGDIPEALKALATDLRNLGQSGWADRITLSLTMRREGRALASATQALLKELEDSSIPRRLGYAYRVAALEHAAGALQLGHRLKPPTLQRAGPGAVWHPEGFQVRIAGLSIIYRELSRMVTVPLEVADGGTICRLVDLRWDGSSEALAHDTQQILQDRIIAALLFLEVPCRIYCE